jgi:tetrahydromethanopterin S-methyltransferase subunit C
MDENTIWLIAATVIAALIGAIVGAMISGWMTDNTNMKILQIQQKNELKALANEFLTI